jgi:excinuclease ABC subunit A
MVDSDILIQGAREHNLREVSLVLPRNRLICFTGVSGSGKSSLAFDTLYAEGQRRYVESLSSFARQFLGQMPKPDVDLISGLSPSISISQKSSGTNPRSTVGTITEIYDYLRVLFARVGKGHCPDCHRPITAQTRDQIIDRIGRLAAGSRFMILAPLIRGQKGEYRDLFVDLQKQGYLRARVDGRVVRLTDDLRLDRQMRHNIEVVIDRLVAGPKLRPRLAEAVELALRLGEGNLIVAADEEEKSHPEGTRQGARSTEEGGSSSLLPAPSSMLPVRSDIALSAHYACTHCQKSFEPPSPQLFSFNSPQGMCPECSGLGQIYSFDPQRLIPEPAKSFQQGCIELLGKWREMGRWKRHIFRGVADSLERKYGLPPGGVLETAWEELDERVQHALLWGTGDEHVTFTWRGGSSGYKWGGPFEGIIPKLLAQYRNTRSRPQRRQLEKYMRILGCGRCEGRRLNAQACAVTITTAAGRMKDERLEMRDQGEEKPHPRQSQDPKTTTARLPTSAAVIASKKENSGTADIPHPSSLIPHPSSFILHPSLSLPEVCRLAVSDAAEFFSALELDATGTVIAAEALKEIRTRLQFLKNVGLEYLALDRTAPTLSGGEMQRIRLAGQIGCGLVGVLYILDEPSIGLHPRDNDKLLETLAQLRDQGNTVVVVEHDEDTMRAADHIVDFGPGPGVRGGRVVASGSLADVTSTEESLTGGYLSGRLKIEVPAARRPSDNGHGRLVIRGARHNNLKNIDVEIPLGLFVCVTGVSGSGKSSLVNDILAEALHRDLNAGISNPGEFDKMEGIEHLDKMIAIDQSPIGRTPRSNPATYIKVFDEIRHLYTQLPEAKAKGFAPGRFSFNVSGGRCEACEGNGSTKLEMDFLADIWVTCPVCEGHRFNRETLSVRYKGKSIAEVLEMDVQEALTHFENIPAIADKLRTLHAVGLDYVKLGQPSPTLSGGEAQRIKLARELVKKGTGRTLYLLDEPTTGLHFADIQLLLKVLHDFVEAGNSVLVVEHNSEVIKTADWIIDLGPEGGAGGGRLLAAGTPEEVARNADSSTGRVLKRYLPSVSPPAPLPSSRVGDAGESPSPPAPLPKVEGRRALQPRAEFARSIIVRGARQHNLKGIDVEIPRDKMTVCCGPSGSGKTSLAMDTIYAEGQRRYVESLSSYARQFVDKMQKPRLDHIEGLSPAICIEQKHAGHSPRSTVGTVTEIYDYLRIIVSRLGQPHCPACDLPVGTQTADEIIDKIMQRPAGTRLYLMAPLEIDVGDKYEALWEEMRAGGYVRVRIDGQTHSLDQIPQIDRRRKHRIEVVIDRVEIRPNTGKSGARSRVAESVENALAKGRGVLHVVEPNDEMPEPNWPVEVHSQHFACEKCGRSFELLSPHNFSFNSPLGWCPACEGLGVQTGTNPAALLRDPKLTLAQGAVGLWPGASNRLFGLMLESFSRGTGIPIDVPYDQLGGKHRRLIMHGTGEQWFEVLVVPPSGGMQPEGGTTNAQGGMPPKGGTTSSFRFQFKGLYPALDEASRISPSFRGRLEHLVDEVDCTVCGGSRLRDDAAAVRFRGRMIDEICRQPLGKMLADFRDWKPTATERKIAGEVYREICNRTQFLVDVGLDYLTLARPAPSLSGGEMQRIRLAAQVGSGLCGVLYVLDEPTIGLHPRDNTRLLDALKRLRDLGNTLLLVEHDREVIASADKLLDFGPAAGRHGGQIVAQGTPAEVGKRRGSVTGPYLTGKKEISVPTNRRMAGGQGATQRVPGREQGVTAKKKPNPKISSLPAPSSLLPAPSWLEIRGARQNNLKNIDVKIPLGTFTVVTGPSGSGKSSLVEDVLYASLARTLHRAKAFPGAHDSIRGVEQINKVIRVDQQPLGQTPSSNPATFTGAFDLIRELFAQLPEAKLRGYPPRRFSFNVPGGRCDKCEGNGQLRIEMHFLPDVWVECDTCHGHRYNEETLSVRYHGKSIDEVLEMPCGEAVQLFKSIPKIRRILQTLCDVGLEYITLGQSAPTLSGGEAQRVKLASELARPDTGNTLYLLDEPTTGLHFDDLAKLLDVLNRLVELGNTVVVIEHNLDVIKTADWVIDMGPEAGDDGGYVVVAGTPEEVVAHAEKARSGEQGAGSKKKTSRKSSSLIPHPSSYIPHPSSIILHPSSFPSHTGEALAPVLAAGPHEPRKLFDFTAAEALRDGDREITEVGQDARMPWEIDGRHWHTVARVGRNGKPCRWEGRVLADVVDRIQNQTDLFSDTDWNSRSVVEIRAAKKSDGWFFHAITGEEWLLKMKFRTAKNTFSRDELVRRLDLKPLNDMPDLPLYGTEPRVRLQTLRGPWQEIEFRVYNYAEIDRPEFWKFIDQAVAGFGKYSKQAQETADILQPWKQLGRKWHFARRGFPLGGKVEWEMGVLEGLVELLNETAPYGQLLWNNKQVVPLYVPQQREPWAAVQTKRLDAVHLHLAGPKGRFAQGRITDLGFDAQVDGGKNGIDVLRIKFRSTEDLRKGDLASFLKEHLAALEKKN